MRQVLMHPAIGLLWRKIMSQPGNHRHIPNPMKLQSMEYFKDKKFPYAKDSRGFDEKHLPHSKDERLRTKEIERQIIEKELQRQRTMAISGRTTKTGSEASTPTTPSPEIVRFKREVTDKILKKENEPPEPDEVVQQVRKKRTVIIQKKKGHPVPQGIPVQKDVNGEVSVGDDDQSVIKAP